MILGLCFNTLPSQLSCKWDNQWAVITLVLWLVWLYRGNFGSTITSLWWSTWDLKQSWKTRQCWERSGRAQHDARVTRENNLMTSQSNTTAAEQKHPMIQARDDLFGSSLWLQNGRKILSSVNLYCSLYISCLWKQHDVGTRLFILSPGDWINTAIP